MKYISILEALEKIPDRVFPKLEKRNYPAYFAWREVCHLSGSILSICISHLLFLYVWEFAPIIIFDVLVIWMTYQEFYLHKKKYNQPYWHGTIDWAIWSIPFALYLLILF